MTRFARGAGSKGSNEKVPEDGTSWQEMKAAMMSKRQDKKPKTIVPEPVTPDKDIPTAGEIQSVWAELVGESKKGKKEQQKNTGAAGKLKKKEKKNATVSVDAEASEDVAPKSAKAKKRKQASEVDDNVSVEAPTKKSKKKKKKMKAVELAEILPVTVEAAPKKKSCKKPSKDVSVEEDQDLILKPKKRKQEKMKANKTSVEDGGETSTVAPGEKIGKNGLIIAVQKPREKKRKKEPLQASEVFINGKPVKLAPFDGFIVQIEDVERLRELRQSMIAKGIPPVEREKAMKLERRRAEKALARLKKKVCFHCRGAGHNLSECPLVQEDQHASGICYKCGSTEHTYYQCKVTRGDDFRFAECFICKEQGHISKQCPDNPRGLYPRGGACAACGDVTHLKKDCPQHLAVKEEESVTVATSNNRSLEALEEDLQVKTFSNSGKKVNKRVKF